MKKIYILILTVIMVFGCSCFGFAADVEDSGVALYADVNEKLVEMGLPEFSEYDSNNLYVLFKHYYTSSDYKYCLAVIEPDNNFYSYYGTYKVGTSTRYALYFSNFISIKYYSISSSKYNDFSASSWSWLDAATNYAYYALYGNSASYLYYSDFDIYSDDTCSSFFFLETPHPQRLVLGIAEKTMQEVLTPQPILTMMGGLVSLLTVSVLLFLAFRKGWKMLLGILRRA